MPDYESLDLSFAYNKKHKNMKDLVTYLVNRAAKKIHDRFPADKRTFTYAPPIIDAVSSHLRDTTYNIFFDFANQEYMIDILIAHVIRLDTGYKTHGCCSVFIRTDEPDDLNQPSEYTE